MKRLTEFDISELEDPSFSRAVIEWQKQHGRHALPWQNTRDAYRIWLSEIMLQQTQVTAVLGYYARFLERFPTVAALAEAPLEDVMAHWSGLGYYTRARNLHACARRVVEQYGGVFPSDPALLAELPGIGRSTAAAISAFSSGTRAAILDGNVKRVFARVFGVDQYPGLKPVEDALWRRAEALTPADGGIEAYTQGLMDLGATLCTRSRPDCERCPLQARCVAYATGRTAELPVRKPKKETPEKRALMLAVVEGGQVLLQQRPESGIWGGLLSLPEFDGHVGVDEAEDADVAVLANAAGEFGTVDEVEPLLPLVHGFTHYKLHIQPFRVGLAKRAETPAGHVWWDLAAIGEAPLPAPVKKLLGQLAAPTLFG
ncbi:A/G-specific adenine glycosylase [Herbaspirillum sp. SJZ107]|uniref:A/G-specific adenine glycosylase n=1 Tax=Herbaspirillum sp. SJZ107 TaxID=2572881 RepID=UPI00115356FD|nr:A/G-specific adenine glycosylase [Herbaspirillum sp. SJZ107]TQK04977.1 A/G-specific DNA-adenine glycosylase [Herbaspirillum sp. SJZ107]